MLRRTDAGIRLLISLALVASSAGCVAHAFNEPITLSTKAAVAKEAERIRPVSIERCAMSVLLIIPLSIVDPRDGYDDLLGEARLLGGNAVIDFQLRSTSSFTLIPLFQRQCMEYSGVAARM